MNLKSGIFTLLAVATFPAKAIDARTKTIVIESVSICLTMKIVL